MLPDIKHTDLTRAKRALTIGNDHIAHEAANKTLEPHKLRKSLTKPGVEVILWQRIIDSYVAFV